MKVILMMAVTVDGKIGRSSDHFPDWTGREDKRFFAAVSKRAGVVIMGARTFDTFKAPLPGRKNIIMTRDKRRKSQWENLSFTDEGPSQILHGLEQEGYEEVILAGGAQVNSMFAGEQLIDEVLVTIAPKVFGRGLSLFAEEISMDLRLEACERLGDDLVSLRYRVLK